MLRWVGAPTLVRTLGYTLTASLKAGGLPGPGTWRIQTRLRALLHPHGGEVTGLQEASGDPCDASGGAHRNTPTPPPPPPHAPAPAQQSLDMEGISAGNPKASATRAQKKAPSPSGGQEYVLGPDL